MLDTYFDRCDAASGYRYTTVQPDHENPRYFRGSWYATTIDCNVAKAKHVLRTEIELNHCYHAREVWHGFRVAHARIGATA